MKIRMSAVVLVALLAVAPAATAAAPISAVRSGTSGLSYPKIQTASITYGKSSMSSPGDDGLDFLTVNYRFALAASDNSVRVLHRYGKSGVVLSDSIVGVAITDARRGMAAWSELVDGKERLRAYVGSGTPTTGPTLTEGTRVMAVHRNTAYLVDTDGRTSQWDLGSPNKLRRLPMQLVRGGFLNDVDDKYVLSTVNEHLRLLDRSGRLIQTFDTQFGQFSPDGSHVLLEATNPRIYDLKTKRVTRVRGFGTMRPYLSEWTADGHIVVVAAAQEAEDPDRPVREFACGTFGSCKPLSTKMPQYALPEYPASAFGQLAYALDGG